MTAQESARAVSEQWIVYPDQELIRLVAAAIEAAVAAERARCVALARDWVPGDVLAELEETR